MKMGYRWLILTTCLLLGGCVHSKILEDDLLIQMMGLDRAEHHGLRGTFGYSNYLATGGGGSGEPSSSPPKPGTFQAEGRTEKQILTKINEKAALPVKLGQLRVVLFGRKLASDGLNNRIKALLRDPEIGEQLYLAVADGTAAKILTGKYGEIYPIPSMYLAKLLKQNIETMNLPKTNLHVFSYHLDDPGSDPVLPLIRKKRDQLALEGLALFKNDRYVGKLGLADMFIFKRMVENTKSGEYEVKIPGRGITVVRQITSAKAYEVRQAKTDPSVTIHVKIGGVVVQSVDGLNFNKEKAIKLVEQTMEKEIEQKGEQLIRRFQKLGIDPLGIGAKVRTHDRDWSPKKWKDLYPNTDVTLKVDVTIKQTGTTG
jgi:spore germination protein